MDKIITILEAKVSKENWNFLRNQYRAIKEKQSTLMPLESFLLQKGDDPGIWLIVSIWENMEALQRMRSSEETPAGVVVFRKAGAEPTLSVFEAMEQI